MSITMKEIAYLCGVSRGTVDRVLNDRGGVKAETAERIRAAAESMGYRSNIAARTLSAQHKQLKIGVLVNAIGHQYFSEIMSGMIRALEGLSTYNITGIIKLSGGFDVDQQLKLLDELMQQGVNAVAITPANSPRVASKLREFTAKGIPVIVVSALIDGFDYFSYVGCNHYLSGRIAGGFAKLIVPARSKVAILTGSRNMTGLNRRVAGFSDAVLSSGDYSLLDPVQSSDDDVIAYKAVSNLVSRHPDIDLFFFAAGGYSGGFQALGDAHLLGKAKVIAFDVQEVSLNYLKKGFVSALFNQHPHDQGRHAVKQLADYLLVGAIPEKRRNYEPIEILIDESFYAPPDEGRGK
jgi:LacI family transcriptional regulator